MAEAAPCKILIALYGNDVAPRFDLATEVLIAVLAADGSLVDEKTVVLPQSSAEQLCHMSLTEGVQVVICGAIEDEYYQYLSWKKVQVLDSVIGPYDRVLARLRKGVLQSGDILFGEGSKTEDGG